MQSTQTDTWWLYIVQTKHAHWYTGISNNVARRFMHHQQGKGAKFLRGKGPLTLIFAMPVGDKSAASQLEAQVKKLKKTQKQAFVQRQTNCLDKVLLPQE